MVESSRSKNCGVLKYFPSFNPQQTFSFIMARISHLKKRDAIFRVFEDLRKSVSINHNLSISKMVEETRDFVGEISRDLKAMQKRVAGIETIFE